MVEENASPRRKRARNQVVGILSIVLSLCCIGIWAVRDVGHRIEIDGRQRAEALSDAAVAAETLYGSEAARLNAVLVGLRSELRAQGQWPPMSSSDPDLWIELQEPKVSEGGTARLIATFERRLLGLDAVVAVQWVTAERDGLSLRTFARTESSFIESHEDAQQAEAKAKQLWFEEEFRRAVGSAGRRVERGAGIVTQREKDEEVEILRAAIGLHEPGDLIQGVLVAHLDPRVMAKSIGRLAVAGQQIHLLDAEGRALGPFVSPEQVKRFQAPIADLALPGVVPGVVQIEGLLLHARPLSSSDDRAAAFFALAEMAAPTEGWAAWRATAWPQALAALFILGAVTIRLLWRGPTENAGSAPIEAEGTSAVPLEKSPPPAPKASRPAVTPSPFVVRDWLADIRGCLEREAATRGLGLEVWVQPTVSVEVQADAAWLGGLVVAMGREALDATAEERVQVRVSETAEAELRIEVHAGGVDLAPIHGMEQTARELGGHFESTGNEELILIVPSVRPAAAA